MMKHFPALSVVAALVVCSCTPRPNRIGSGYLMECLCHTDTVHNIYSMGNKYPVADSIYTDSCNTLRTRNGWDTCQAAALVN